MYYLGIDVNVQATDGVERRRQLVVAALAKLITEVADEGNPGTTKLLEQSRIVVSVGPTSGGSVVGSA